MDQDPEQQRQRTNNPAGCTSDSGEGGRCPLCGGDTHMGLLWRLLTYEDLCEIFQCGESTIRKWEKLEKLNRVDQLGLVRFLPIEVIRLLKIKDQC